MMRQLVPAVCRTIAIHHVVLVGQVSNTPKLSHPRTLTLVAGPCDASHFARRFARMSRLVIIADFQHGSLEVEQGVLGDLARIEALDATSEEQLWGRVEEADALMVFHTLKVTRATIERLKHCQLIVRCGVGYDNVDHAFARSRGIPVANVPDYGTEEVADSAIGMLLALTRGIARQNTRLRPADADWRYHHVAPLYRLRDRTLAIVGLGRIGTAVAVRGK